MTFNGSPCSWEPPCSTHKARALTEGTEGCQHVLSWLATKLIATGAGRRHLLAGFRTFLNHTPRPICSHSGQHSDLWAGSRRKAVHLTAVFPCPVDQLLGGCVGCTHNAGLLPRTLGTAFALGKHYSGANFSWGDRNKHLFTPERAPTTDHPCLAWCTKGLIWGYLQENGEITHSCTTVSIS